MIYIHILLNKGKGLQINQNLISLLDILILFVLSSEFDIQLIIK